MKKTFLSLFIAFSFLASAQTELPFGTATGTNSYSVQIDNASATLKNGIQILVKVGITNTTASTLKLNALATQSVSLNNAVVAAGDIIANVYTLYTYNASAKAWQMSKPGASASGTGQWNTIGNVLGADTKFLGSTDNFNVGFKTNNTVRETILKGGQHIWGTGTSLSGSETYSFQGGDIYVDDNFLVNNAIASSTRTLFGGGWIATAGMTFGVASTTNGTLVFKNSTNANTLTINSGVTSASHSWTLPLAQGAASTMLTNDGSGVLSWVGASSMGAWMLDGNTVGSEKWLGTIDNFSLPFRTNNVENMILDASGNLGIGVDPTSRLHVKSSGATLASHAILITNSANSILWDQVSSGQINVGDASGNIFMGFNSGLNITSGYTNTGIGYTALAANSSGQDNTAYGSYCLTAVATTHGNSGFGEEALRFTIGTTNAGFGKQALLTNTSGSNNTAVGFAALHDNSTGGDNTAVGQGALFSVVGSRNIGIGFNAGSHAAGSDEFYLDNRDRITNVSEKLLSIIYGQMAVAAINQILTLNAKVLVNGRMEEQQGTDVASASTIALTYTGNTFELTGTTSVTLITSTGWQNGSKITLIANESVTITNGTATSGADITIRLAGAANFNMAAGDDLTLLLSETTAGGQVWREVSRTDI